MVVLSHVQGGDSSLSGRVGLIFDLMLFAGCALCGFCCVWRWEREGFLGPLILSSILLLAWWCGINTLRRDPDLVLLSGAAFLIVGCTGGVRALFMRRVIRNKPR
jgi:hypothetical protein